MKRCAVGLSLFILSVGCATGSQTPAWPDAATTPPPDAGVTSPDAAPSAPPDAAPSAPPDAAPTTAPDAGTTGGTTAHVVVHYPTSAGHHISIRGNGAGLSWDVGVDATLTAADAWVLDMPLAAGIELKPLYDDATWAIGPNWTAVPGQTLEIWPIFFHTSGRIEVIPGFHSSTLSNSRNIEVYLPPSYDENPDERYPVVYMHDGQNLFYDDQSFGGVSWNVAGALDQGANDASIHEAIVVGIDNNSDRIWEYTPVPDPSDGGGGGDSYLQFITDELKPAIDARYRTMPDKEHTGMIGSSLGGLISAYAGLARPDVFGLIGAMSPSTWWDNEWIIGAVQGSTTMPGRMYLDSGDSGPSSDDVSQTARLADAYRSHQTNLEYVVQPGGQHNEYYWRQRLPGALSFLLGAR